MIRILAVPVLFVLLYDKHQPRDEIWAAIIFGIAFFTDYFDGWIARRTKSITRLGRVMDPLADKLMVLAALIILVDLHRVHVFVAVALLGRELTVSGLRDIAAIEGIQIPSRFSAKAKTMFEGFGLGFLISGSDLQILGFEIMDVGNILVWIALILAFWSAGFYFRDYIRTTPRPPSP